MGLEHGASIILDEQETNQLTEAEIDELHEAFLRRIDQKCQALGELDLVDSFDHDIGLPSASSSPKIDANLMSSLQRAVDLDLGSLPCICTEAEIGERLETTRTAMELDLLESSET